jgi:hypothetical protein
MISRCVTINFQLNVLVFVNSYIQTRRQRKGCSANKSYKTLDCGKCGFGMVVQELLLPGVLLASYRMVQKPVNWLVKCILEYVRNFFIAY